MAPYPTGSSESSTVLEYAQPWLFEKLRIFVDGEGIRFLLWNSPSSLEEVVTENTAMLPFEDIQSIFEKMMPIVDNPHIVTSSEWTSDIYIHEVRLGLMRVTERDIGQSGLLVPVWDFLGHSERVHVDEEPIIEGQSGYTSMLTINAIDGSIIDRLAGY